MSLKIAPVQTEEIALLVDISRKTFYDTFYQQNSPEDMQLFLDQNFTPEKIQVEVSLVSNHFFFAKEAGEIAGYLKLSLTASEFNVEEALEISRIYVVKEKLGAGVGKAFMQFSISFAKENNKRSIVLGVWEHNEKAITFYRNFGFTKIGEHIFMLGNDSQTDWLMQLKL